MMHRSAATTSKLKHFDLYGKVGEWKRGKVAGLKIPSLNSHVDRASIVEPFRSLALVTSGDFFHQHSGLASNLEPWLVFGVKVQANYCKCPKFR